jgi:hypothetical protein
MLPARRSTGAKCQGLPRRRLPAVQKCRRRDSCRRPRATRRWAWAHVKQLALPERTSVTPSFKGKTECIDHVCARIKLHTRLDIVNTKISATGIKSYYKPLS